MKIIVLNGSPKGETSTTLQYVRFLQTRFAEHDFQVVAIAHEHEKYLDDDHFWQVLDAVRSADGVLWAFPVYSLLVHPHLKQFIELVFDRNAQSAFAGKYTAALSTSIHFFDNVAHNYVHAICDDWDMRYVGAFSAWVYDLLGDQGQQQVTLFAESFFSAIERQMATAKAFDPVTYHSFEYVPAAATSKRSIGTKNVLIMTDSEDDRSNVARMVERFRDGLQDPPATVNLHQLAIRTACVGCFRCGADGLCAYRDTDDLHDFYTSRVASADIVVMAGTIKDRYLSSRWKVYFDRGFFGPVIPWLPGKQVAFLVSGPLKQIPNLRQLFEGYADFHQANLVGIVTDECQDSAQIDRSLDSLAERLLAFSDSGYVTPRTFLGVGSTKIFRDQTWGMLRPIFQEAYRYYRRHGMYDFPHNNFRHRAIALGGMLMTSIPPLRKRFFQVLEAHIVKALQKAVAKEARRQRRKKCAARRVAQRR